MDNYIRVQEIAEKWNITVRQVQLLCKNNRIPGAVKFGNTWAIPRDAEKPMDLRKKHSEQKTEMEGNK